MYKNLAKLVLIIFVITGCSSDYKNINDCKSLGTLELICNLQNPEDFAKIPEEDSIVVSQFAGLPELNEGRILIGKLSKLDLKTNEIEDFDIEFLEKNSLGIGDENCKPYKEFYPHGIDIYSIEFFLIFPDYVTFSYKTNPTLIWVGCTKAPKENTYFNDVVIYDNKGSFFATHQYDKDLGFYYLFFLNIFRFDTGHVYEWNSKVGYSIVPKSAGTWPNGIEMIDDDLYVNYRTNGMISKFSNGIRNDLVLRTFLNGGPDNVIAVGDELWIGGQNTDLGQLACIEETVLQCPTPFFVIHADKDLNIIEEYNFEDVAFGGASVAYPFEDRVFVGAYKSDRIGIFKR